MFHEVRPLLNSYDVVVSGGGIVGSCMYLSLQALRESLSQSDEALRTAVSTGAAKKGEFAQASPRHHDGPLADRLGRLMLVDAGSRPVYDPQVPFHHLRTVSVTPTTSKMLENLGIWPHLSHKHGFYRMALRTQLRNDPALHDSERSTSFFMTSLLGRGASTEPLLTFANLNKPMGYVLYNTEVNSIALDLATGIKQWNSSLAPQPHDGDVLAFGHSLSNVVLPPLQETMDGPLVGANLQRSTAASTNGSTSDTIPKALQASLVIACEGRGSLLRTMLETPCVEHAYGQVAFVCNVEVEKLVDGNVSAYQNFFLDGKIIGYLPTSENTANLVFSTSPSHAKLLLSMSHSDLVSELNSRLYDFAPKDFPRIKSVVQTAEKRVQGSFPLTLRVATKPFAPRCLLVGDAAHGIHPFAGQGLNLGMYDVCALTGVLESAIRAGGDLGSVSLVGEPMAAEMFAHTAPVIGAMEFIKSSLQCTPSLATIGMHALDRAPLVSSIGKSAIMKAASGAFFATRHKESFLLSTP